MAWISQANIVRNFKIQIKFKLRLKRNSMFPTQQEQIINSSQNLLRLPLYSWFHTKIFTQDIWDTLLNCQDLHFPKVDLLSTCSKWKFKNKTTKNNKTGTLQHKKSVNTFLEKQGLSKSFPTKKHQRWLCFPIFF